MARRDPAARRLANLTSVQIERKRAIDRANQQQCQRRKKARLQWLEQEVTRLADKLAAAEAEAQQCKDQLRQYAARGCVCGGNGGMGAGTGAGTAADLVSSGLVTGMGPGMGGMGADLGSGMSGGGGSLGLGMGMDLGMSMDGMPGFLPSADAWSAPLRELLDFGNDADDELSRVIFDYPLPLPAPPAVPMVPAAPQRTAPQTALVHAPVSLPAGNAVAAAAMAASLPRVEKAVPEVPAVPTTPAAPVAPVASSAVQPPVPRSLPLGDLPPWQVVPMHMPPTTDLDKIMIEITNSGRRLQQRKQRQKQQQQRRRQQQQQEAGGGGGGDTDELSQAQFPSITSLLNPNLGGDDSKPLTTAMAMYLVQKANMKQATARIGLMYTLSHLLRWLVQRDKASYDKLPDYVRPTALQCTVPHPAWIDVVVWPDSRDRLIRDRLWTTIGFEDFRRVTGNRMSVNWPYTDSGAFEDLGDGQQVLSPLFENHIRQVDNWSLTRSTAAVFPFLAEHCNAPDTPDE